MPRFAIPARSFRARSPSPRPRPGLARLRDTAAPWDVLVIGGGATGVSVADNLARRGGSDVHLFHSGEQPLPGYHPRARSWIVRRLTDDGVTLHPDHRAVMPPGFAGDRLTTEPIEWSTGQPPFTADVALWAVANPFTDPPARAAANGRSETRFLNSSKVRVRSRSTSAGACALPRSAS